MLKLKKPRKKALNSLLLTLSKRSGKHISKKEKRVKNKAIKELINDLLKE